MMIYSGNIGICPVNGNILVDNMTNSFDLYSLSCTSPTRSFVIPMTKIYAKKGIFGEKGNTVITGSDHGKVYLFAVNKTDPIQILEHGRGHVMIQTVKVNVLYIFSSRRVTQHRSIFRQLLWPIVI